MKTMELSKSIDKSDSMYELNNICTKIIGTSAFIIGCLSMVCIISAVVSEGPVNLISGFIKAVIG